MMSLAEKYVFFMFRNPLQFCYNLHCKVFFFACNTKFTLQGFSCQCSRGESALSPSNAPLEDWLASFSGPVPTQNSDSEPLTERERHWRRLSFPVSPFHDDTDALATCIYKCTLLKSALCMVLCAVVPPPPTRVRS